MSGWTGWTGWRLPALLFILGTALGAASRLVPGMLTPEPQTTPGPPPPSPVVDGAAAVAPVARSAGSVAVPGAVPRPAPPALPPLSVLFMGNSYLAGNSMPSVIAGLALADGQRPFEYVLDTPGSFTLQAHVATGRYRKHLASRRFDFVVLQEQSQRLSYDRASRDKNVNNHARVLHNAIADSGAQTVLFMTWARRAGNKQGGVKDDTYARMQRRVATGYTELQVSLGSLLAPVGLVWQDVRRSRSDFRLFKKDGSHPTPEGTYLAACVLYTLFYGRPVSELDFRGEVDVKVARFIRQRVDRLAKRLSIRSEHSAGRAPDLPAIPGIVAAGGDDCPRGYAAVQDVCYHSTLDQEAPVRDAFIHAYKGGAIPPLVAP